MKWHVYGFVPGSTKNYDGKGGSNNIDVDFDDEPTADRFAKDAVEVGVIIGNKRVFALVSHVTPVDSTFAP